MGKNRATQRIQNGAARSSGVGESRLNIAEDGGFAPDLTSPFHPANCTIGHEPIPEHLWDKILFAQTDQGMEERGVDPDATVRVEIGRDEVHQSIRRRGGDLDRGLNSIGASGVLTGEALERGILDGDAFDPRRELVLKHVPVGMRPKFLSAEKVDSDGAGAGGYRICMDSNGKPVRHGSSVLGYIPEAHAVARQQRFEEKSREAQSQMYDKDLLQQERTLRGGSPMGDFEIPDNPMESDLGLHEESFGGGELTT